MVLRPAGVLGEADHPEAEVRPQRVRVDARVRLNRAGLQLIDVHFPLVVRRPPAHVGDFDGGRPRQFALDGHVPVPRLRDVEDWILHGDDQGEVAPGCPAGCVDRTVDHGLLYLKRRIAAERRIAIDHRPVVEQPEPGAKGGLLIHRVREAESRLKQVLVRFSEAVGKPVAQPIEFARLQLRDAIASRLRRLGAGQHDAVESIAARDEAALRIHLCRSGGIVEGGIEHRDVPPSAVPRRP